MFPSFGSVTFGVGNVFGTVFTRWRPGGHGCFVRVGLILTAAIAKTKTASPLEIPQATWFKLPRGTGV